MVFLLILWLHGDSTPIRGGFRCYRSSTFAALQKSSSPFGHDVARAIGDHSVDQNTVDALRRLLRLLERGHILDRRGVENNDVRICAGTNLTAIIEPEPTRRETAHLVHGRLQRKQAQLAAVVSEHPGERSPKSRMRMLIVRQAVRADH